MFSCPKFSCPSLPFFQRKVIFEQREFTGIQCVLSKQLLLGPQKSPDFETQCFCLAYHHRIMSANLEASAEVGTS